MGSKFKVLFLSLAVILCLVGFAANAQAQEYVFGKINAAITIPDDYTVITENTIDAASQWLLTNEKTKEAVLDDFAVRGVLLQAWNEKGDACLEVTAVKDETSEMIFDVDEQSSDARGAWRVSFYPKNLYEDQGFSYKSSNWKNMGGDIGRFLVLKYNHETDGVRDYSAHSRKTIKNGFIISIDMKVFGRNLTTQDNTALNKIWKTWRFTKIEPLTNVAKAKISLTDSPLKETKSRKVSIAGNATEGVEFTAVVMSLSSTNPDIIKVTADKRNKFEIPIIFAQQGVYLITVTANYNGEELIEWAFPVTFRETLLAVDFSAEVPTVVTTDELKIRGAGEPGAQIQILMNDKPLANKRITSEGKFSLTFDTSKEGDYTIVLVFSKKGLQNRRFKFDFKREQTLEQKNQIIIDASVKPTYKGLLENIDKYKGKLIYSQVYITNIQNINSQNVLTVAYSKKGEEYADIAYVISDTEISDDLLNNTVDIYSEYLGLANEGLLLQNNEIADNIPLLKLNLIK
ncbi:MAG: hypothetical protein GYA87_02705 [Christensenellaceae bacterium]|nr:hypothetical protein [Christensenellaceae bacterium]